MYMSTSELRSAFLEYFRSQGHQVVSSSSLVPHNDPTLLFTNAGMNQFKDVFLGADKRAYNRATTAQRCVRAGGKHNDLENVGYTARHHTFFEMLGNFSFGDYFKQDAIRFAWEFLTGTLKLPKERLLVTVYETDDEAFDIWAKEMGVPVERIVRIGDNKGAPFASDNFWQMGDTGPCGPCTEIFYDHGDHLWGGPPGSPEEDGDRFIEIWNVVFMQFNRQVDGTMEPLPRPSVDTGMGLERISAIMQGVHSNYEIDIFQALIKKAAEIVGTTDLNNQSLRVIADHIRSCAFLVADGVMPSNEGRGYVLRRIIRRAVRHGRKLGATDVFFYKLAAELAVQMKDVAAELIAQLPLVERVLRIEEEQFVRTLDRGLLLLEDVLTNLGDAKIIPGEVVFKLYDTYGFPADLTADVVREREIGIDEEGFNAEMEKQRARAKEASSFGVNYNEVLKLDFETPFTGYKQLSQKTTVVGIYKDGVEVNGLISGEEAVVVLAETPFYAESGGQVGDSGILKVDDGIFAVTDTQKAGKAIIHKGYLELGTLEKGAEVEAVVDGERRQAVALNHSVTHLLHAALRQALGDHVTQKGSLVGAERMRFDFSHFEGLTMATIRRVEELVNAQIRANHDVNTQVMDLETAKSAGAMALFGEKYEDDVRVVRMGDYSTELCGGTHAKRTGDIGFFKIIAESGIAAGVRRIEAVTGKGAIDFMHQLGEQIEEAAALVKGDQFSIADKVRQMLDKSKMMERELEQLKAKLAAQAGSDLLSQVIEINGRKVLIAALEGADPKSLRGMLDELKNQMKSGVVLLATSSDDKVNLIAGVTSDLTGKVKAGELVNLVAQQVGGKGGGRPDMAQAGGTQPEAVPAALQSVHSWLEERL
ncbi:alanine--tRNA ligase [Aeromonas bestiarum]|jgi:alanyl-tRNA synthetase|uniref:Alanine--tRNA ligase n=1 Tax=Aeromonas bestiarum TaxID=105751 RepID=A0ABT7Q0J2_9GAMM|nr:MULTISPECIES: alanine--tRNA ligase [Aeromonas]ATL98466.1 alanine--tRNA ligase [Aeromonas sp. CA23]EKP0278010.1 alanine--tRNA ligase [Aeromonas bestiarum]MCH7347969.1 alanine--tRNA ligase [Aeromonas sp. MR7]MDM5072426.1 alanine--tRNA ligase [Aeromonas bestiarum]MDM5090210.1 alanine--tRNA ligase [Aeromonas bestiarum]